MTTLYYLIHNNYSPPHLNTFFSTLNSLEKPLLSLFSTDPVFFKSLLVFSHKRPSTKATTDLIDFERLLTELQEEKKEIVERVERHNLGFSEEKINEYVFSSNPVSKVQVEVGLLQ